MVIQGYSGVLQFLGLFQVICGKPRKSMFFLIPQNWIAKGVQVDCPYAAGCTMRKIFIYAKFMNRIE